MIPNFQMPDASDTQASIRMEPEPLSSTAIIVHLVGYIDTYNSQFFAKQMSAVHAAGYNSIILGCRQVTYISSTGVGAFTTILKEVGKKGKVIIAEPATKILEVFQLLGFASFFPIFSSLEEAKSAALGQVEVVDSATFPKILSCSICNKKLKVTKPGMFRCPECKTGLIINELGDITLK